MVKQMGAAKKYRNPEPPDINELTIICRAIVNKHRHLFAKIAAHGPDDLLQIALIAAHKAHVAYEGSSGMYKPWIGMHAENAIKDLRTTSGRQQAREQDYAAQTNNGERPGVAVPKVESPPPVGILKDVVAISTVAQYFDSELEAMMERHAATKHKPTREYIEVGIATNQRARRALAGQYKEMIVGNSSYTPDKRMSLTGDN